MLGAFLYRKDSEMSSLGEEDGVLHTPRQMNSKSDIKKNTCVSLAQLLYWMPNIFRLQSTGLFKVSYFCSSLNNLVKLWFKEDKHKYIKDKWSQKLYCSLLFISKL